MLARITPSPLKGTVPAIASSRWRIAWIICAALANGDARYLQHYLRRYRGHGALSHGARRPHRDRRGTAFQVHPTMKSVEFGLLKALAGGTLDCGESGSTPALCCLSPARWAQRPRLWVRDA